MMLLEGLTVAFHDYAITEFQKSLMDFCSIPTSPITITSVINKHIIGNIKYYNIE